LAGNDRKTPVIKQSGADPTKAIAAFGVQACQNGTSISGICGDTGDMKMIRGKPASASKTGYFIYLGIKVAKPEKPQSETAE